MEGCGAKIQIGMGAFETCGSDYYGSPIYCERCKLLLELKSYSDKHLKSIGMYRNSKGEVLSNGYGNIQALKVLGVKLL